MKKTLREYAEQIATAVNGRVIFMCPNCAVIEMADRSEFQIPGPTCHRWRSQCNRILKTVKAMRIG